jgi:hypothetical protein
MEAVAKNVDVDVIVKNGIDTLETAALKKGIDIANATEDQLLKLFDESPSLKNEIETLYRKATKDAADKLIANTPTGILGVEITNLITRATATKLHPSIAQRASDLYGDIGTSLDRVINQLQRQGTPVPKDLQELRDLITVKQLEADEMVNFKRPTSAPGGFKPDPGGVKVDDPQIPGKKYQVGMDPEFDSAFDFGLSSAAFKLSDEQSDKLRQVLYNIYKQGNLTLTQFYKQFEDLGQKLAKSSDERTASFGRKILNLLKKVAGACGKDLKITIKTLWIAPSCALGFWGLLTALSLGGDIIGIDNNFWKGLPCAFGSIVEGIGGDGELQGFWKDMCDGGGKFWESDNTSKEPKIEDAKAWIGTLNGVGEDLEGLSVTDLKKDPNGVKNMYIATLSDGRSQKLLWDPTTKNFTPQ